MCNSTVGITLATALATLGCGGAKSGAGGSGDGYRAEFPSDQHPPATSDTQARVEANKASSGEAGFDCAGRTMQVFDGPRGMSGNPIPGAFSIDCSSGKDATFGRYEVRFVPTADPKSPTQDTLTITCMVRRSLEQPRCTELLAVLLK